jgi:hypothetical protein
LQSDLVFKIFHLDTFDLEFVREVRPFRPGGASQGVPRGRCPPPSPHDTRAIDQFPISFVVDIHPHNVNLP